jgi:hypothetical protein
MTPETAAQNKATLPSYEILQIAHHDAERAYRDLSHFRITLALKENGWHVDYDLLDPMLAGGGPHYLIDPVSGAILWKTYEQ